MYTHQEVAKEFLRYWQEGFLPRGQVFSVFYEHHKDEAVALFNLMYFAKDWDTFYKTACWAREYANEGMFLYALHAAILHRHDTQGIVLPPIYEINPYFFVNTDVIDKVYEYKMTYEKSNDSTEDKTFYINANYSGSYVNFNPAQTDMAYFYEDVGLNAYYFYYNVDYPFWLGDKEFGLHNDRRGELFFYLHQQLLARYYLERLSNGHGSTPIFDWEEPIKTGYVPSVRYPNGLAFPIRPAYSHLVHNQPFSVTGEDNVLKVQEIEDYERRIRDAIDFGFIFTVDGKMVDLYKPEGFDLLGKIIEGSPDSPNTRFYGLLQVIAHQVLGYSAHPTHEYKIVASALEQFSTCMRDPIFYQLYKRIVHYFYQYQSHLPHYKYSELHHPGVEVESIEIDKLETYFSKFEWDLSNALYVTEEEFIKYDFKVYARQLRLDHKPFTYKINLKSDKSSDVVVRIFLGPKHDEHGHIIPLNENRINFVELDKFVCSLNAGKNAIERTSTQGETVKDRTTWRELYRQVMSAIKGEEEFLLDMSEAHNGFPNRFILPKGQVEGQEFQFFVYISPYTPVSSKHTFDDVISAGVGSGTRYVDNLPFGYPFDRRIEHEEAFFVPNSHIKDVIIYHSPNNEKNNVE